MNDRARAVDDDDDDDLPDGDPARIVRRAPFAQSPFVGERGQQAQLRLLEAGLEAFGHLGYHGCGIKQITEMSGYSRASFYQYFSSKEDLFRHLAGRVAREMTASAEALTPVTGDEAGWQSLADWLARWSSIYDAYKPVFVTFQTAAASDAMVRSGSARVASRTFTDIRKQISGSTRTGREITGIVRTLLDTVARVHRDSELLELSVPGTALGRRRINLAFTDAYHRALFGPIDGVNVHTSKRRLRTLAPAIAVPTEDLVADAAHGPAALRTRDDVIEAGHRVFVERGYYNTRVVDVVRAAGVSHGVFYRYFENKTHLFRFLAERAAQRLSAAVDDFPPIFREDVDAPVELRRWLRHYTGTYTEEATIFAMWSEAISRDEDLGTVSVNAVDNTVGRFARQLKPRGWGDADADAMVLLALVDSLASQPVTPARVETIARMIEWGLLEGP
jgi:AcrR family transcriptional regulator